MAAKSSELSINKLTFARYIVSKKTPYFSSLLWTLVPRAVPNLKNIAMGPIGVSKNGIMMYDPTFIEEIDQNELAGVLVHEIMHFVHNHHDRGESKNPEIYNIAGDLTINPAVLKMGYTLPDWVAYPAAFNFPENQTAEWYYDELMKSAKKQKAKGIGNGQCGSCGGNAFPDEPTDGDKSARSQGELDKALRVTAEQVKQAAQQGTGNVPSDLLRWAEEQLLPPKVRWQDKLNRITRRSLTRKAGLKDYTYSRPSRRQLGSFKDGDPIKPSMYATVPNIVVAIDTSGSMGSEELSKALSEIKGILSASKSKIEFIAIDCSIHSVKPISNWKDSLKLLKGGGGTDFRPVFDLMDKRNEKPDILIFLTDGMGPAPQAPPFYKVIWILIGAYKQPPCDWGEQIFLE